MYRPPIYYRGCKKNSLQHLIFPEGLFVDVFGGSGIVTLNRTGPRVYNDIDPDLCNFFTTMRDNPRYLWERLQLYLCSREEWETVTGPERAAVRHVFSQMGSADSFGRVFKESINHIDYNMIFPCHNALRNVIIENADYQTIFDKYDSPDTVFYCDPPYLDIKSSYGTIDHKVFLNSVFRLQGYCAVSGYPNPLYEEYPWTGRKSWQVVSAKRKKIEATEVLWYRVMSTSKTTK